MLMNNFHHGASSLKECVGYIYPRSKKGVSIVCHGPADATTKGAS